MIVVCGLDFHLLGSMWIPMHMRMHANRSQLHSHAALIHASYHLAANWLASQLGRTQGHILTAVGAPLHNLAGWQAAASWWRPTTGPVSQPW